MRNNFIKILFEREILELKTIHNKLRVGTLEMSIITFCFFPLLLVNIMGFDLSFLFWISLCGTLVTYIYQFEVAYKLNKSVKEYESDKKCRQN